MKIDLRAEIGYRIVLSLFLLIIVNLASGQSKPELIQSGFLFTEGPTVNDQGILFFSDVPARKIYKYTGSGNTEIFLDNSGGVNGLFYHKGNIYACAGKEKREVISIDASGKTTTIIDNYQNKKLNSPNDLWVDKNGGIYFTDPRYGNPDNMEQDGEHVYYISPNRKKVTRIIDDMVRPNGIVGNPQNNKLYVVDQGVQKTYVYDIRKNGKLSNKKIFAECGIDGMSIGKRYEVFITAENAVRHYDESGELIHSYTFEKHPTNVFYDKSQDKLYITTQGGEVYIIRF